MGKINHIAIASQDPDKSARLDSRGATGYHLSDGDTNNALGRCMGQSRHINVEVKYGWPDGVIIDVSETG
jgi:hypothetical protein